MDSKEVVVIGAGLGGLSAAIRLGAAGYRVTVLEQSGRSGGKAGSMMLGAYRFDTGPSLITMPEVFDQLFEEAGAVRSDLLPFQRLDTVCSYFFPDGSRFNAPGDPRALDGELVRTLGEAPGSGDEYLEYSRKIYEKSAPLFLHRSLHEWSTYRDPAVWRSLLRRGNLDVNRTMDQANRSFFRDPRTIQLFNRYATYNGSSPYKVPATLNIIPHVEYGMGAFGAPGGIYSIVKAMESLAVSAGVNFRFGEQALGIECRGPGGAVSAVRTGADVYPAGTVISNVDVQLTYRNLLNEPEAAAAVRYRSLEPSSSGLVFFWGMKRQFPELGLNNIFFSGDYPAEFRALFEELRLPGEPTVYVNITSKISPEDAPSGRENWFVLVNAPRNAGQSWKEETERVRKAVISRLNRALNTDIEPLIAVEETLDPAGIEAETGSLHGSLYGISSNTKTAAFLRHRNRSTQHPGLYFTGGSVHPGGGMPLAVLSGKIAADLVRSRNKQS